MWLVRRFVGARPADHYCRRRITARDPVLIEGHLDQPVEGAPPFKARDLSAQMRRLSAADLERWILLLAEADLELKGSKRPPRATVEDALMQMCRGR